MPSKQQKKNDKAEQREIEKQKQQQLLQEEQSWEKGTNKRALSKIQQQNEKQEEKIQKKEEQRKLEEQKKLEKQEQMQKQEQEEKKLLQKGIVDNRDVYIPNQNNDEESNYTGSIDDALDLLNEDEKDSKVKDILKEFYNRQLPILKEEQPGLRLNQYKERIYKLWKKSPENPYSNK